jgi:PKHD-type hydroxylase
MTAEIPNQFIQVPGFLKSEELTQIDSILERSTFIDGSATATDDAKSVKNNQQLPDGPELYQVQAIIQNAISQSPLIQASTMPIMVLPALVSQYEGGMSYGWHVDSPLMGSAPTIRTDVGMTVFLSDPTTYVGGELVIQGPNGQVSVKMRKGDAIIYPTTRLHGVAPVTQGKRQVAVTWMQCAVRNADKRELLFQLRNVQESVFKKMGSSSENQMLQQIYSNLLRDWCEL